jgi:pyruvate dehydrogenase E2 component (dihydrolipoamide acetyltransferase)
MAETISMPKLGFDMREGVLVRWVRNEGEEINKGDVLAEIETDKATVEVESSASGVVRKLLANPGDSVPVGSAIAIVGTADEKIEEVSAPDAAHATKVKEPVTSSPAPVQDAPQPAPAKESNSNAASTSGNGHDSGNGSSSRLKASPLARKVASESSLNLANIRGTGPGGRIVRRDVEAVLKEGVSTSKPAPQVSAPPTVFPTVRPEDQRAATTKLRQAIGRRMVESKQNLPHFYVTFEYKMNALLDLRKQVNAYLPESEKISVNDFVIKAVALTLREFPNLNASLNGNEVIRHGAVNVGVAVTVEGGLLTVVSKDTDMKPLRQISSEVRGMAARVREGKIKPEDVDGSTFSTSNLGMYDVENFAAIINPPEAAILAIGAARGVAVVEDSQVKVGSRMKCTISVDHRISDGAEAARFMQALAKYLEEPLRLLV